MPRHGTAVTFVRLNNDINSGVLMIKNMTIQCDSHVTRNLHSNTPILDTAPPFHTLLSVLLVLITLGNAWWW